MTLIDTPGIASATPGLAEAARDFLAPEDERPAPADAVLYLMRHVHSADVRFLEAFHDDEYAHASPLNTIAVLSRADELGTVPRDVVVDTGLGVARGQTLVDRRDPSGSATAVHVAERVDSAAAVEFLVSRLAALAERSG